MRIIKASTLALTLAGCLSGCAPEPSPPPVTQQQERSANLAFIACLVAADRRLDDHISDASTIALALRPSCNAQFARAFELGARGLSPYGQELYDSHADAFFLPFFGWRLPSLSVSAQRGARHENGTSPSRYWAQRGLLVPDRGVDLRRYI